MIRENKKAIITGALVMLLPVIAGLLLWNKLPDQIPTHWNFKGEVDSYASKTFAVFGLNAFLYVVYAVCLFATAADPKRKNIGKKSLLLVISICPVISLFGNGLMIGTALGMEVNSNLLRKLLLGCMFVLLGNFLPKMRQSYTIGIKLPWTLASEDNWNRTHRFAGRLWIGCGLVFLVDAFIGILPSSIFAACIIAMVLVPSAYSYLYFKKQNKKAANEE